MSTLRDVGQSGWASPNAGTRSFLCIEKTRFGMTSVWGLHYTVALSLGDRKQGPSCLEAPKWCRRDIES